MLWDCHVSVSGCNPTTCHAQVTHGHHIKAAPSPALAHFIRDEAAHAVATVLEPLGTMANQGGPEMFLKLGENWKFPKLIIDTLQQINISHLGKRKIIFKMPFLGDMLVPWRVTGWCLNQPFLLKNIAVVKLGIISPRIGEKIKNV